MYKFPTRTYLFQTETSTLKNNFGFYLELLPFSIQEKGPGDEVLCFPPRVTRHASRLSKSPLYQPQPQLYCLDDL